MFYVGQKVVAIKNHSQMKFKKGDEFIVLGFIKPHCKCKPQLIDIGIYTKPGMSHCDKCNTSFFDNTATWWFSSKNFAPLEEYRESYSIAIQLVQEMEQVDKQKVFNPKKETIKN